VYTPLDLRQRRWPTVVVVTLMLAGLGGAGLWYYRDHLPAWLAGRLSDSPEVIPSTGERSIGPESTTRVPDVTPGRAGGPRPEATTPTLAQPPIERVGRVPPPVIPAVDDPVWPPAQGARTPANGDDGATAARPVVRPQVRPVRPSRSHRVPYRSRQPRATTDADAPPILD
jgi:hypothetical protein